MEVIDVAAPAVPAQHAPPPAVPPGGACPNCRTPWPAGPRPNFCGHCGQELQLVGPGWAASVGAWVAQYARTLAVLVLRPGRLTDDHIAGRRKRYVPPWRLYLHLSFAFFVVVKLLPAAAPSLVNVREETVPRVTTSSEQAPSRQLCPDGVENCGFWEGAVAHGLQGFERDPHRAAAEFRSRFAAAAPYAAFLLLPTFAGLLMLAYRRRQRPARDHLLLSVHMHAAGFLLLIVQALVPAAVRPYVLVAMPLHGVLSLQAVYRGRWWATLARAGFVAAGYGIALGVVTLGLVAAVFVSA